MSITIPARLLLDGVEATGASDALDLGDMKSKHGLYIYFTNSGGSLTALVVELQAYINGTWFTITTKTLTSGERSAKIAAPVYSEVLASLIRVNITTLTETGTTKVYVSYNALQ